jgi:hypothetical protein
VLSILLFRQSVTKFQSSDSEDSYFHDPDASTQHRTTARTHEVKLGQRHPRNEPNAQSRKLLPSDFVIPLGPSNGVWGMIKRVGRWRTEGWSSLFKGSKLHCVCLIGNLTYTFHQVYSPHVSPTCYLPACSRSCTISWFPYSLTLLTRPLYLFQFCLIYVPGFYYHLLTWSEQDSSLNRHPIPTEHILVPSMLYLIS